MEYTSAFPTLSDDADLWMYASDRPLDQETEKRLAESLSHFFEAWTSHGRKVRGAMEVLHHRFLVIAAEVEEGDISGCGIDASIDAVHHAGARLNISWLPSLMVFYRDSAGTVADVSRSEFRRLVRNGEIASETPVFDLSVGKLGDLRDGHFEQPAGMAWHARVFKIGHPAPLG